jgi:hypothetical protein
MAILSTKVQRKILETLDERLDEKFTLYGVQYRLFTPLTIRSIRENFEKNLRDVDLTDTLYLLNLDNDESELTAFAANFVGFFDIDYAKLEEIGKTSLWLDATGMCRYIEPSMQNLFQGKSIGVRCGNPSYLRQFFWGTSPDTIFSCDKKALTQAEFFKNAQITVDSYLYQKRANGLETDGGSASTPATPKTPTGKK